MGKIINFMQEKDKGNIDSIKVNSDDELMANDVTIIKEIMYILKAASIKKFDDIVKLNLDENKLLSAQKYSWIGEIAKLVNSLYYKTEKYIGEIDGQIFLIDKVGTSNYENVMKYSCVFPNRTIMSSGDFHYLDKPEYAFIDIDFFSKLFYCKNLLLEGIVHISPFQLLTDSEEGIPDGAFIENLRLPDKNKKKIAELDECGLGAYQGNQLISKLFVAMPWLENAKVEDYIDIVNKFQAEFECYNHCLAGISGVTEDTETFIKKYLNDYKEASINLQIAMEKKQSELRTKGITTMLSLCLTAIPYLLPEGCIDANVVSAFLGAGTVKEMLSSANIFTEKKNIGKDNPFWVLWKWGNI